MRPVSLFLPGLACAAMLAGCAHANTASLPSVRAAGVSESMPDAVAPAGACGSRVYVADYARNDVEIFPASNISNPKPCGKLVTGIQLPLAVYVDNKGTVYVSDYSGPNGNNPPYPINVFPKGKNTPSLTIDAAGPGYDLFVGKGRIL